MYSPTSTQEAANKTLFGFWGLAGQSCVSVVRSGAGMAGRPTVAPSHDKHLAGAAGLDLYPPCGFLGFLIAWQWGVGWGGAQEGASEKKETEVSMQPRRASAEKPQDTTSATNDAFLHRLIKVVIGAAQSWGEGKSTPPLNRGEACTQGGSKSMVAVFGALTTPVIH